MKTYFTKVLLNIFITLAFSVSTLADIPQRAVSEVIEPPEGTTKSIWDDILVPLPWVWQQWGVEKHKAALCITAGYWTTRDGILGADRDWVYSYRVGAYGDGDCKKRPLNSKQMRIVSMTGINPRDCIGAHSCGDEGTVDNEISGGACINVVAVFYGRKPNDPDTTIKANYCAPKVDERSQMVTKQFSAE